MGNYASDGRGGFKYVGGYQDPSWLLKAAQQERAQATIASLAINYIETIIKVHQETLESPQFESSFKVHDWRNHVPLLIRDIWGNLTMRERAIIYYLANWSADTEEWE
jgi:hypothetical protein